MSEEPAQKPYDKICGALYITGSVISNVATFQPGENHNWHAMAGSALCLLGHFMLVSGITKQNTWSQVNQGVYAAGSKCFELGGVIGAGTTAIRVIGNGVSVGAGILQRDCKKGGMVDKIVSRRNALGAGISISGRVPFLMKAYNEAMEKPSFATWSMFTAVVFWGLGDVFYAMAEVAPDVKPSASR